MGNIFGGSDNNDQLEAQLAAERKRAQELANAEKARIASEAAAKRKGMRGIKSLLSDSEEGFRSKKDNLGA